jgi:hypothetical protein
MYIEPYVYTRHFIPLALDLISLALLKLQTIRSYAHPIQRGVTIQGKLLPRLDRSFRNNHLTPSLRLSPRSLSDRTRKRANKSLLSSITVHSSSSISGPKVM